MAPNWSPFSIKWTDRKSQPRPGDCPPLHHSPSSHFLVLFSWVEYSHNSLTSSRNDTCHGCLWLSTTSSPSKLMSPIVKRFGRLPMMPSTVPPSEDSIWRTLTGFQAPNINQDKMFGLPPMTSLRVTQAGSVACWSV